MRAVLARAEGFLRRTLAGGAGQAASKDLPSVLVALTQQPEGRQIARVLTARARFAQPVLRLPDGGAGYLVGRSRQALRTNLTRCDLLGLVARPVTPAEARRAARRAMVEKIDAVDLRGFAAEPHGAGMVDWLGYDADGSSIGFARIQVDGSTALLKTLFAIRNDDRSIVRYRLSADLFRALAQAGVETIVLQTDGTQGPGLIYFGRRLGFEHCAIVVG